MTKVELGVSTLIGLILLAVMLSHFIHYSQLGEGTHSGYITAVDQRGYIFKNYDVYFKTDNSSSQEDLYCAYRKDTDLAGKLKEASQERRQVTITYKGVRAFGLGLCGTTQIIKVE